MMGAATRKPLAGRRIVLGVSGSIAAYKSAQLASLLAQSGADLRCAMTPAAARFITPLTLAELSRNPVADDLYSASEADSIGVHTALASWCELMIVAPASANTIAKMAMGAADNVVTAAALAFEGRRVLAPAMETGMYTDPAVRSNLVQLQDYGWTVLPAREGYLASGSAGVGRMAEPDDIAGVARGLLGRDGDLARRKVVVTAGGTREPIDSVRFIANDSLGLMGHALAEAARDRGAEVTLITAARNPASPPMVKLVEAPTALRMREAVSSAVADADLLVMAAAVSDFGVSNPVSGKIATGDGPPPKLELTPTPDIAAGVKLPKLIKVVFAAETSWSTERAREKLVRKGAQLVVLNNIADPDTGFGSPDNRVAIIAADGEPEEVPLTDKYSVADIILDRAREHLPRRKA